MGYGSLARKIVEEGADYLGMDVAPNPVNMLKESFDVLQMHGDAVQGDFLENRFESDVFDYVVSISIFGCVRNQTGRATSASEYGRARITTRTLSFSLLPR